MATHNLSKIVDKNGEEYLIKAKGLEDQVQISLTGDVSGSATTDFTSDPSISTTIGAKKVTTSKIDDSAVTTDKINDKAVTLDKIADAAKGGAVQDNDGVLATHAQVKDYVDAIVAGEGKYRGVQTVATINSWTVANLNNGDRVITADAGTITFNGQSLAVVADQELVLWKDTSTNPVTAVWQTSEGNYKLKQTAKTDPTASGTTITAIDTISQDSNGDITATKKTIRSASTSQTGVVQLAGSIGATVSSENNKAASEKAVRDAINALDAEKTSTDGTNVQVKVTETDGKITAVNITTDNTENKNNKVTSWSSTTTDTHYPSEKLVKDSLDGKADKVSSATANDIAILDANGNLVDSGTTIANAHVAKADQLNTARNIDGVSFDGTANIHHYGECSTAAGTAAKTVTLSDSMSFTLAAGAKVYVKFTNSNSVENPTLAVNGTTAKNIYRYGTTAPGTSAATSWQAGSVVELVYNGSAWIMVGWLNDNTTYTNGSLGQIFGECTPPSSGVACTVTNSAYSATTYGVIAIKFVTRDVPASATLNINRKGDKAIYYQGAAITAGVIKAGDVAFFMYDSTSPGIYHLLGTDHAERAFTINYRSSDNALVISKAFGTAS